MTDSTILITATDNRRLRALLASKGNLDAPDRQTLRDLLGEIERAQVVDDEAIPPNVITMNSRFRLRDLDTGYAGEYALVYPGEADFSRGKISVLAPIGTALLGYRELDAITWKVPAGLRRLRVDAVLYQPEAEAARVA